MKAGAATADLPPFSRRPAHRLLRQSAYGLYTANQSRARLRSEIHRESQSLLDPVGRLDEHRDHEFSLESYRDYMMWLMDRQIKEGGCQHFLLRHFHGRDSLRRPGVRLWLPTARRQASSLNRGIPMSGVVQAHVGHAAGERSLSRRR